MSIEDAPRLRHHWWPRPGWRPGRISLTWHLTFENAPGLHRHVAAYQRALDGLPGLDPVPAQWLHLTVQKLGYADETPEDAVPTVVEAVRAELALLPAFDLTFDRPVIFGEAIAILGTPVEPVHRLRTAIRTGITNAAGPGAAPSGGSADAFRPHVTIAYCSAEDAAGIDAGPHSAALAALDTPPATVRVGAATLIRQERLVDPPRLYRWAAEASAALAT